jgi:Flp pilus assembly protein TadB
MVNGVLSKLGLSKIAPKVNNAVNTTARDIAKTIKEKGIGKESRKSILVSISDMMEEISDALNEFNDDLTINCEGTRANIAKALSLTIIAACINSLVQVLFVIIITPVAGTLIATCLCAPLVEEFCKRTAIKGKYIKEFTIVFNMVEFTQYVTTFSKMFKLSKLVIIRLFAVGMHISTTITQWILDNPKLQEKLGISKDDEDGQKKASLIGYILGVIIHAAWNTSAALGPLAKVFEKFITS